jgi:Flp pilus assembly protein CpaB
MGNPLNPTVLNRLSRAVRPDFARTVLARRVAAGLLVVVAAVIAWRPDPRAESRDVVVAVRDLAPGITITADDVTLLRRPAGTLPDGAVTAVGTVVGATLAGPSRRGEVLTDARVLGSRLAGLSVGAEARIVPVHLTDTAVLDVVRPGDVIDILGAQSADGAAHPRLLAAGVVVVLVSPAGAREGAGDGRVLLVALPAPAAHALARATLVEDVTLTIH